MKRFVFLSLAVIMALALTLSPASAATSYATYLSHTGTMTIVSASTIDEAVSTPYDGKFVQLAPGSSVTLKFPGNYAAVPDGSSAPDLQVDIFDEFFPASAEISVSLNGTNWTSVGVYSDVANIDLDLEARGPVKYVKIDQGNNYIDPLYPDLGFDLDGVAALNAGILPYGKITSPAPDAILSGSVNFEAIYWDDDPSTVSWAVRSGTCAANTGTVIGNVDGKNSPYTWDGHLFKATADTSSWASGDYCFVFNPTESTGETDVRLLQFNLRNDPPVANPGGPYLAALNTAIVFDGTNSSDPNGDSLTFAWDFGDTGIGTGSSPSHTYTTPGVYNVCLVVNDVHIDSPEVCTLAAVYDPTAGFVTGGGWINSPAGAYEADSTLSGKATFGFVAKYQKGANVPVGNTEFQFKAGNLNLKSTSYDWLVVAGSNAKFKGFGTINGEGTYKFMISADDGSPDAFRIQIWDAGDGLVYDNGSQQALVGGNIVVHN